MVIGDSLADIVEVNVDVFCSGMIVVVCRESKGGLVVAIHGSGDTGEMSKDVVDHLSHMHSFAVSVVATYSALAVERVISSCLREPQETAAPSKRNAKPDIMCLCSCEVPSVSVNPTRLWCLIP